MEYLFEVPAKVVTHRFPMEHTDNKITVSVQTSTNGIWLDIQLKIMDHWADNKYTMAMWLEDDYLGNLSVMMVDGFEGVSVGKSKSGFGVPLQFKVVVEE